MKLVHRIINLCIVVLAIIFAVLNRDRVEVDLFVIDLALPLYIAVLGALAFGWLWGQFVVGITAGRWRRRARRGERRATSLAGEVTTLRETVESGPPGDDASTPAAPRRRLADRSRAMLNDP